MITAVLYGVCIALFAGARFFPVTAVVLLLAGFMRPAYRALSHTMPLRRRQRGSSMYFLDCGFLLVGAVMPGVMTARISTLSIARRIWRM